eukprot:gene17334-17525_t
MRYLRNAGAIFAKQHPKIARRLELGSKESPDPHTERLLESFAFLSARLSQEIDERFPQIASALLDVTYPHLINPIPAMTIAQFQVDPTKGKLTTGYSVAKGSQLFTYAEQGRTSADLRDVPGTDIHLSFVDLEFNPSLPPHHIIYAQTLCTNRFLAEQVPTGAELQIEEAAPISRIVCLDKPVPQMASITWRENPSVKEAMIKHVYEFDFDQAIHILEALNPESIPLGEGDDPGKEAIHIKSRVSLAVPPTELDSLQEIPDQKPILWINFLSIAGIQGPLPTPGLDVQLFARFILNRFDIKSSKLNGSFALGFNTWLKGELKTFIEIDFFGSNAGSTYSPRIRHAYGEYLGVLAGQTLTVFGDVDSLGTNVDINGINGGTLRQPQVRYTMTPMQDVKLMIALERPVTDYTTRDGTLNNAGNMFGSSGLNGTPGVNGTNSGTSAVPDLTAQLKWSGSAGHIALRGVARQLAVKYVTDSSTTGGYSAANDFSARATAWGVGIGGKFITVGKSGFFGQINGGDGIGRYIYDLDGQAAFFDPIQRKFQTQRAYNGILGYEHYWQDNLRTNLMASYTRVEVSAYSPGMVNSTVAPLSGTTRISNQFKKIMANIIYSPVANMDVGFEVGYFKRETIDHRNGQTVRTQLALTYKF